MTPKPCEVVDLYIKGAAPWHGTHTLVRSWKYCLVHNIAFRPSPDLVGCPAGRGQPPT